MDDIKILSDNEVKANEIIKIHIDYSDLLTLKELSDILNKINMAINDFNREKGNISNVMIGKNYSTRVSGVESGSIILCIATNFVLPVALSVLGNLIYDRLKNENKKEYRYPLNITINGNDNLIDLNIDNSINKRDERNN